MDKKNFIPISSQIINEIFGPSSYIYLDVKKVLETLYVSEVR